MNDNKSLLIHSNNIEESKDKNSKNIENTKNKSILVPKEININVANNNENCILIENSKSTNEVEIDKPVIKKERIYWVEWLRILASILVVYNHCTGICLIGKEYKFGKYNWKVLFFQNSLCRSCVPFFLMISGMFLLDPKKKKKSFKLMVTKYFYRIFKCYVFWSLYYNLFNEYVINVYNVKYTWNKELVKKTIMNIIKANSCGHMWYLKLIMCLYLVTPILRSILYKRKFALTITLFLVFTCQFMVTSLRFWIPDNVYKFVDPFETAGSFTAYYMLGYFLKSHDFSNISKYFYYFVGFLGIALTEILRFLDCYIKKESSGLFGNYSSFNVTMSSVGLLIFFKYFVNERIKNIMKNESFKKVIVALSDCSFGVYLVHMTVYHLYVKFKLHTQTFNPLYWAFIYTAIIYTTSFVIIYLLRKIKIFRSFT